MNSYKIVKFNTRYFIWYILLLNQGQFATIEANLLKIAKKCGNSIQGISLKIGRFSEASDTLVNDISSSCPQLRVLRV